MKCMVSLRGAFWVVRPETSQEIMVPVQGPSTKPMANAVMQAETLVRKLHELGAKEIFLGGEYDGNGLSPEEWVFFTPKGNRSFEAARQNALAAARELGIGLVPSRPVQSLEQLKLF